MAIKQINQIAGIRSDHNSKGTWEILVTTRKAYLTVKR